MILHYSRLHFNSENIYVSGILVYYETHYLFSNMKIVINELHIIVFPCQHYKFVLYCNLYVNKEVCICYILVE